MYLLPRRSGMLKRRSRQEVSLKYCVYILANIKQQMVERVRGHRAVSLTTSQMGLQSIAVKHGDASPLLNI